MVIIFELCKYGNLKSLLEKNAKRFINQVERVYDGYRINIYKTEQDRPNSM